MLDERAVRLGKLEALQKRGINGFAEESHRTHMIADVLGRFEHFESSREVVTLAGRVMIRRGHGAMCFVVLEDESGKFQVALRRDAMGEEQYQLFQDMVDPADFCEFTGVAFITKRGEKSLDASGFRLLTKALAPLPEKWHGLTDVETRYRKRYLDLIANESVRDIFRKRSLITRTIREILDGEGFMEVETPILQPLAGGASARPFVTHHNTLDIPLYLRIAPELYLKRLLVGGFEKVYEIARCFRNEGVSFQHNPEFTQVEFYWAYAGFDQLIGLSEKLISSIVSVVTGGKSTVERDGATLNFSMPLPRLSFFDLVQQKTGIDLNAVRTESALREAIVAKNLLRDADKIIGYGELADALYKEHIRPGIVQPSFVMDYPVEMKPLAKRKPGEPNKAAAFQLVVQGMEVINAYYHELNDPLEQKARFADEQKNEERGAEAAMPADADFIESLEHGMPPAAGFGMGIDRLCMMLLGVHGIKEVILFPTLKPESK